jgi:hypothetical protein
MYHEEHLEKMEAMHFVGHYDEVPNLAKVYSHLAAGSPTSLLHDHEQATRDVLQIARELHKREATCRKRSSTDAKADLIPRVLVVVFGRPAV